MLLQTSVEFTRISQQRAIDKSRRVDPNLEFVRRIGCGSYEVHSNSQDKIHTVSVSATGYACSCDGARHPACAHRASAYRLRLAERTRRAMVTVISEQHDEQMVDWIGAEPIVIESSRGTLIVTSQPVMQTPVAPVPDLLTLYAKAGW